MASAELDLNEAERHMLKHGTYGDDSWTLTLLLAKGLVCYRRRYFLFGPRKLRLTARGKQLQQQI